VSCIFKTQFLGEHKVFCGFEFPHPAHTHTHISAVETPWKFILNSILGVEKYRNANKDQVSKFNNKIRILNISLCNLTKAVKTKQQKHPKNGR
jgi:hypothetical protein